MENIEITTDMIQLDQLLKWAGLITTGGQVKELLEWNAIKVNGQVVKERRKKIYPQDIVEIEGLGTYKVTTQAR